MFKYIIRLDDYKVKNDDSFMVADDNDNDNDKSRSVNIFCNNMERHQGLVLSLTSSFLHNLTDS